MPEGGKGTLGTSLKRNEVAAFEEYLRQSRARRDLVGFLVALLPLVFLTSQAEVRLTQDKAYLAACMALCLLGMGWRLVAPRSYCHWRDWVQFALRISVFASNSRWRLLASPEPGDAGPSSALAEAEALPTAAHLKSYVQLVTASLVPTLLMLPLVHPTNLWLHLPAQAFAVYQAMRHKRFICRSTLLFCEGAVVAAAAEVYGMLIWVPSLFSQAPVALPKETISSLPDREVCAVVMALLQLLVGFVVPAVAQLVVEKQEFLQFAQQWRRRQQQDSSSGSAPTGWTASLYSWLMYSSGGLLRWEAVLLVAITAWYTAYLVV
ncbi:hypothetical protein N2152v2_008952 [Parachlorella kessleri]